MIVYHGTTEVDIYYSSKLANQIANGEFRSCRDVCCCGCNTIKQ